MFRHSSQQAGSPHVSPADSRDSVILSRRPRKSHLVRRRKCKLPEPTASLLHPSLNGVRVNEAWFYEMPIKPESPRNGAHVYWASVAALLIEEPVSLLRRLLGLTSAERRRHGPGRCSRA
jgi:hypothetical protein